MGLRFALGADIRVVAPDAKLGALEISWGLVPDAGGTQLLPGLIGPDRAMELCATGRIVTGPEAVEIGLATRLADDPRDEMHKNVGSPNQREAAAAAVEKRPPVFTDASGESRPASRSPRA